uniref:Uncharacterized protein n=1 Tax=Steinernema glaseri TaxID=37863 RepID=A0A1I8AM89_9BILA
MRSLTPRDELVVHSGDLSPAQSARGDARAAEPLEKVRPPLVLPPNFRAPTTLWRHVRSNTFLCNKSLNNKVKGAGEERGTLVATVAAAPVRRAGDNEQRNTPTELVLFKDRTLEKGRL